MPVRAIAIAEAAEGRSSSLRPLLTIAAILAVLVTLILLIGQVREAVLLSSPDVRAAQSRQAVAQADLQTAQLNREAATTKAAGAAEASWQPWTVGAQNVAGIALFGVIPVTLLLFLVGAGLLFRRHLSPPAVVPLVTYLPPPRRFGGEIREAEGWGNEQLPASNKPATALDHETEGSAPGALTRSSR